METVLIVGFTEPDGSAGRAVLEAVNCARSVAELLGESALVAGLVGRQVEGGAEQIRDSGVVRILAVEGEDFAQGRYASDAAALEALCRKAEGTIVIAAGTARMNRVLSGVAHRLEGRIDTHVCEVAAEGGVLEVGRWYYRQRMKARLSRSHRPWFVSCDPGSFTPWLQERGSTSLELVEVQLGEPCRHSRVEGFQMPAAAEQTIRPDAELLFVAGAGWTKTQSDGQVKVEDAEKLILEFLGRTKASLGGSKSMVDLSSEGQKVLSFMTHLNQIGQTGSSPRHPKGLATCCHGEEPHAVGWRFINQRRAINIDSNCGWAHGKADVLYVEDAFAVLSKVNELLQEG